MPAILDYKCPNCGGNIKFDPSNQQFKCENCDSVFTSEQLKSYSDMINACEQKSNYEFVSASGGAVMDNVNGYICKSCGAQLITDETSSASECPYCGNPVVLAERLSGVNRPDCVIPFKLSKDDAKNALKNFYKGKVLLPSVFKSENRIKEIKGVYVPFWLFDSDADVNITFEATREKKWSDSDYDYTETSYYNVLRAGTAGYENIPVDGSSKMPDEYMEGLEPYSYADMTGFDPAFLSGFMADKYDVDAEASFPRAKQRIENACIESFEKTVKGFDTVRPVNSCIRTLNGKYRYALLPVWMFTTKFAGKNYTFAVNGQTGKVSGELPIDKKKLGLIFGGITAGIALLGQIFVFLL